MNRAGEFAVRAAQAVGDHWGTTAKSCLDALGRPPPGANLGMLYVSEELADDLPSILTFLRETTTIADWVGAVGFGVFGPLGEIYHRPAMAVLVARVPADSVRLIDHYTDLPAFRAQHGAWTAQQTGVSAVIHGDPRDSNLDDLLTSLADGGDIFVLGGVTPLTASTSHFAGRWADAGLSGLLLGDKIEILTGLTQGCTPIGPVHRVSESHDNVVMALDGQPALEVLRNEAGDLIGGHLQRAAGLIHIALPIENSDTMNYRVRNLLAVDPRHGWIAVAATLAKGDRLMLVRRDPSSARHDLRRMVKSLAHRLGGRLIRGGLYVSCVSRGPTMFGDAGSEIDLIRATLGDFPLIGFAANGEFFHNRLYAYTGVLTVFL